MSYIFIFRLSEATGIASRIALPADNRVHNVGLESSTGCIALNGPRQLVFDRTYLRALLTDGLVSSPSIHDSILRCCYVYTT